MRTLATIPLLVWLLFAGTAASQPTLYWTQDDAIQRMDVATGAVDDVLTATMTSPRDVALDEAGGKVYWLTDSAIQRANLDGSGRETLHEIEDAWRRLRHLALDLDAGKMYWTSLEDHAGIQRANLDGSNPEILVADDEMGPPDGLALDPQGGKLYWSAWKRPPSPPLLTIRQANLDGSEPKTVLHPSRHAKNLALDSAAGVLYWTETYGVYRARLSDRVPEQILEPAFARASSQDVVCDPDEGTLYLTSPDGIVRVNLDGSDPETIPLDRPVVPVGLALSSDGLYWADEGFSGIYRARRDGTGVEDLVTSPVVSPGAVALDGEAGKLYWAEGSVFSGTAILRANLDGSDAEAVVASAYCSPYCPTMDFALDLPHGKLYWSTWDGLVPGGIGGIYRANLDGSDVEVITEPDEVMGLDIDPDAGRLYWVDPTEGTSLIRSALLDGTAADTILSVPHGPGRCFAIDGRAKKMYWETDQALWRANLDGSTPEQLAAGADGCVRIAIDPYEEHIYWTSGTGIIRRADLDGSNAEIVRSVDGSIRGLALNSGVPATAVAPEAAVPEVPVLHAAYPNPFNPTTRITYTLPRPAHARLVVYDILGRTVATLVDGTRPAGPHTVSWTAAPGTPSGLYVYRLETAGRVQARTVLLLK